MKKHAFTLAEVLITLVIIGVIAAMTIPTLMGSTNDQELKSKLKKAYSALSQATRLEKALYGNFYSANGASYDIFSDEGSNKFAVGLKNHMSVIEEWDGVQGRPAWKTADGLTYEIWDGQTVIVDLKGQKRGLNDLNGSANGVFSFQVNLNDRTTLEIEQADGTDWLYN